MCHLAVESADAIERVRANVVVGQMPTAGAVGPMHADGASAGAHCGNEPTTDM